MCSVAYLVRGGTCYVKFEVKVGEQHQGCVLSSLLFGIEIVVLRGGTCYVRVGEQHKGCVLSPILLEEGLVM